LLQQNLFVFSNFAILYDCYYEAHNSCIASPSVRTATASRLAADPTMELFSFPIFPFAPFIKPACIYRLLWYKRFHFYIRQRFREKNINYKIMLKWTSSWSKWNWEKTKTKTAKENMEKRTNINHWDKTKKKTQRVISIWME
jgi:hypothetical protein